MYQYRAKLINVVDGDTADFEVDLGFHIKTLIRGRMLRVNTPERGQEDYNKAKEMLTSLLTAQINEDGYIIIKTEKTGKYGRWLVEIDNVNDALASIWPYMS